jgi:HPt (histidine-containing phosphotransfer) domain-containing protein
VKPELECRLDPHVLADAAGASTRVAHQMVDVFVLDAWSRVSALSAALDARDRSALRAVSHALTGRARGVGAHRLSTMCHLLERHAATSSDYDAAGTLVNDIKDELAALVTMFAEAKLGTVGSERGAA